LLSYALYRGIRVVPEFDGPGHTYAFGKSHPEIIVNCSNVINKGYFGFPYIDDVPFDMTKNETYEVLFDFLGDMLELFPDPYIHLGYISFSL
jgi:hexosaminidase